MANIETERIQAQYLERLRRMLERAPADVREDAVREVQSHIEDEWRALGGDLASLHAVLERLGPPESYGRDLALQLILTPIRGQRSWIRLGSAALFWASTSLVGAAAVLLVALTLGFAVGMLGVGIARLFGSRVMLINAAGYRVLTFQGERVSFPPLAWSPLEIIIVGLVPALVVLGSLYALSSVWLHSRLAARGLDAVIAPESRPLPSGWERSARFSMILVAIAGLGSCILLVLLGNLVGIGRPGHLDLPADFWRSPVGILAFLSLLVFFSSPVLGLLWSTRHARR